MWLPDALRADSSRRRAEWGRRLNAHWTAPDAPWEWWDGHFDGVGRRAGRKGLPQRRITFLRGEAHLEKCNGPCYAVAAIPVRSTPLTIVGPGEHVEQGEVVVTVAQCYVLAWRRVRDGWRLSDDPGRDRAPVDELIGGVRRLGLTPV